MYDSIYWYIIDLFYNNFCSFTLRITKYNILYIVSNENLPIHGQSWILSAQLYLKKNLYLKCIQ